MCLPLSPCALQPHDRALPREVRGRSQCGDGQNSVLVISFTPLVTDLKEWLQAAKFAVGHLMHVALHRLCCVLLAKHRPTNHTAVLVQRLTQQPAIRDKVAEPATRIIRRVCCVSATTQRPLPWQIRRARPSSQQPHWPSLPPITNLQEFKDLDRNVTGCEYRLVPHGSELLLFTPSYDGKHDCRWHRARLSQETTWPSSHAPRCHRV